MDEQDMQTEKDVRRAGVLDAMKLFFEKPVRKKFDRRTQFPKRSSSQRQHNRRVSNETVSS